MDSAHADVILLGGGLVGCLTALRLSDAGAQVILVERAGLLAGASRHNAGGIYAQLQPQFSSFSPEAQAGLRALAPLLARVRSGWEETVRRVGGQEHVRLTGGILVATDAAGEASLRSKNATEQAWGIPTTWWDARTLRQQIPALAPDVRGGSYCAEEGFALTHGFAEAVIRAVRESPVRVYTDAGEARAARDGRGWIVRSAAGPALHASALALTLGAHTDRVLEPLGLGLGISRLPLQVARCTAPLGMVPFFLRQAGARLSLKQYADGALIVGGGIAARQARTPFDTAVVPANFEPVLQRVARLFPGQPVSITGSASAFAAWTADGLPALGTLAEGLFVALGANGYTLAPVYAAVLTALAQGQPSPVEVDALAPARLRSGGHLYRPPDG